MAAAEDIDMRQVGLLGFRRCDQFGGKRGIDEPDQHLDAPAAALADLRPERHVERGADFLDLDASVVTPPCGEGRTTAGSSRGARCLA